MSSHYWQMIRLDLFLIRVQAKMFGVSCAFLLQPPKHVTVNAALRLVLKSILLTEFFPNRPLLMTRDPNWENSKKMVREYFATAYFFNATFRRG